MPHCKIILTFGRLNFKTLVFNFYFDFVVSSALIKNNFFNISQRDQVSLIQFSDFNIMPSLVQFQFAQIFQNSKPPNSIQNFSFFHVLQISRFIFQV